MTNEVLLRLLVRLYSEKELAYSSVASGSRKELESWGERKGCIAVEKSGGGKKFKITNQKILDWEIKRLDPQIELGHLPARVQNLVKNNDTKAGETKHRFTYILCKAVGEGVVVSHKVDQFDASALTSKLGCFALPISDYTYGISTQSKVMLVENQLLFDDVSWLPKDWKGLLIYYAGNLSERILSWLGFCSVEHLCLFPDYDAVGISNYVNLLKYRKTAEWFWMDNWEELLEKFGSPGLWQKENQKALFDNLWNEFEKTRFPSDDIKLLMIAIRQKGKMLEQESVMVQLSKNDIEA